LHAGVVAIDYVQTARGVDSDPVRQAELPWTDSEPAPRLHELAILVVMHDAAVHVTIADEHVARRRDGDVGRLIEVRLVLTGLILGADRQENFPVRGELPDRVVPVIDSPKVAVFVEPDLVRVLEHAAFAPRSDQPAI